MYTIDVNCDLGESFGNYKCGMDEEVLPYISSANVACGFHASDPLIMAKTVQMAKQQGVSIGAHPGYPDLVGFGRRNMNVNTQELKAMVQYQIGALMAFCKAAGVPLVHVKPHGAMYNMAAKDEKLALAICEGICEVDNQLILLGLSGSKLLWAAKETGLKCASEAFLDRAYEEDGTLVARSKQGAMIEDDELAIKRSISMIKEGKVKAITGKEIAIEPDSICIHGDGAHAIAFAKAIQDSFIKEGIQILPMKDKCM